MKIALLGTDADILELGQSARALGHEIEWLGDLRPAEAVTIAVVAPGLEDHAEQWEILLDRSNAEAVLVGRGSAPSDLRAEQLKRLAAEAVPLLIVHPIFESVLPYYELDMARRETGGLVRHYNPVCCHPIVAELARWMAEGHPEIGRIHQLTCERRVSDDTRLTVLSHLARDAELTASVAGDIRRVTAIGPAATDATFASLHVQMSSTGAASLRWSVRPSRGGDSSFEMVFIGQFGTVTLAIHDDMMTPRVPTWEVATQSEEGLERQTLEPYDPAAAAIRALAEAVAADAQRTPENQERGTAGSTWDSATRAMEVVDAVELSLEKGRTIEVYQQQLTPRLAFRGTMAALGCGLLMVGFMAVVVVSLLGGAEEAIGHRLLPAWPVVLLAVLALFLFLQMIPLLVHKRKPEEIQSRSD